MLKFSACDTQATDFMREFIACPRQPEPNDPVANAMYAVVAG